MNKILINDEIYLKIEDDKWNLVSKDSCSKYNSLSEALYGTCNLNLSEQDLELVSSLFSKLKLSEINISRKFKYKICT